MSHKTKIYIRVFLLALVLFVCGCGKQGTDKKIAEMKDWNDPDFTIGCMTGVLATREAREKLPKAVYKEYSMPIDAFTAICSKKVDAVVLDRPTLEFMALAHPELTVMRQDLAMGHISVAASKKSKTLMIQVNKFIRQYRKDGTYKQMYGRWFSAQDASMPRLPVSPKTSGTLKVGVTANNEPLCFIKDGKLAGFDSEFAMRLALFLNKEIEFKDIPYDALTAALESGKIDLAIAYMDAMPEREESVLFSENYIDAPVTILYRTELQKTGSKITSWKDLNDPKRTIACESEIIASKEAKKRIPNAKYQEFASPMECYLSLSSGKADAVVYDRPSLEYAALECPKFMVLPENLAMGHISVGAKKENTELIRKVNEFIRKYRKDGTYKQMYERWILSKNQTMPKIPDPEKPDGILTIGITADNVPMCSILNGQYTGFDIEFAKRLALYLNKQIRYMNFVYDGLIPALSGGRIDLAIAQMDATPERSENILFSEEYIDSPVAVMICKKDFAGNPIQKSGGSSTLIRKNYDADEHTDIIETVKNVVISLADSFNKTFIRESRWKLILQGLATTIVITFFSVISGTIFAFPVCMMCRSKRKWIAWLGDRYVSVIMGTPILVILMILYYVVFAKVDINGIFVAILAFGLDFAAYTSVTLRSGIDGIPRGQTEAALALGYTPAAAFTRFVLPQAIRTILPVYRGEIISTLKSTSIVGYIAIMDLTKMGDIIRSRTYEAFFPLIAIAVIYFLVAKCLTVILLVMEKKLNPAYRRDRLLEKGAK